MSKVTGQRQISESLLRATEHITRKSFRGLAIAGLLVKKDSQNNAPKREGNLVSSHYVVTPEGEEDRTDTFKGDTASAHESQHGDVVSETQGEVKQRSGGRFFGTPTIAVGASAKYAMKVHENQRAGAAGYDPTKDTPNKKARQVHSKVGGPKFLENALKKAGTFVANALASETKIPGGTL